MLLLPPLLLPLLLSLQPQPQPPRLHCFWKRLCCRSHAAQRWHLLCCCPPGRRCRAATPTKPAAANGAAAAGAPGSLLDAPPLQFAKSAPAGGPSAAADWDPFGQHAPAAAASSSLPAPRSVSAPHADAGWAAFGDDPAAPAPAQQQQAQQQQQPAAAAPAAAAQPPAAAAPADDGNSWEAFSDGPSSPAAGAAPAAAAVAVPGGGSGTAPSSAGSSPPKQRQPVRSSSRPEVPMVRPMAIGGWPVYRRLLLGVQHLAQPCCLLAARTALAPRRCPGPASCILEIRARCHPCATTLHKLIPFLSPAFRFPCLLPALPHRMCSTPSLNRSGPPAYCPRASRCRCRRLPPRTARRRATLRAGTPAWGRRRAPTPMPPTATLAPPRSSSSIWRRSSTWRRAATGRHRGPPSPSHPRRCTPGLATAA